MLTLLKRLIEFSFEAMCFWTFVCWKFKSVSTTVLVTGLFIFVLSSWLGLEKSYISKNLSVYAKLSIFIGI